MDISTGNCSMGQGSEWFLKYVEQSKARMQDISESARAASDPGSATPSNQVIESDQPYIPYSVTPRTQPGPQDPSGEMAERLRLAAETQLLQTWNTNDISEAKHMQAWIDDPARFARDVVGYAATLSPDVLPGYVKTIHDWIMKNNQVWPAFNQLNQMDIGIVGQFGWLVFPEFRDYLWSRHIQWNTNDFINTLSDIIPATEDPEVAKENTVTSLALLETHAAPGWKEKIPAGLKVKFIKAFFPQEIEAAAIATKQAADKAKFIGIAVVGVVAGGLLLSLTGKKRAYTTVKK